jgi:hypothetical protein
MFNKIWKEQIAQPKGKATIWQPKEKMKPDVKDEEDKCCEEAKKYLNYFALTGGIGEMGFMALFSENCKELKGYVEEMLNKVSDYGWPSVSLFWDDCEHEFVEAELWHTSDNWVWGIAPREDAWDKV